MTEHSMGSALVALLERDFRSGRLVPGSCRMAGDLPRALWERALLQPARDFLQRPGKEFRARLVAMSWALAGGEPRALPAELPLVVELLHAGSLIVDDIEDASERRRGGPALHRIYGTPVALNTGNWLYFWSLVVLGRNLGPRAQAAMQAHATRTLMHCHQGQGLDLATRVCELPQPEIAAAVEVSTGLKTGALMEFAAVLGATAAGAGDERCRALGRFGYGLGLGLQMLDDLGGLVARSRRAKAREDVRLARLTWPWAWLAQTREAQDFARWQERARRLARAPEPGSGAGRGEGGDRRDGAAERDERIDAFMDELAGAVAEVGRARIARRLSGTLDELHHALGPCPQLVEVEREVARLRRSYG